MIFYKHYIGDFQRDTSHLSLTERGAYRSLLDHHYATEKPLPKDVDALCRIVGAVSKADRAAVASVVPQFWTETEAGWVNARAQVEMGKAQHQRTVNREIGKRGGRPKGTEQITESVSESVSESKANRNPIHSHSKTEDSDRDKSLSGEASPSVDQALYSDARKVFGKSIGGQVSKAIKLKGKPWFLGVLEACRAKDSEQARAYFAAAMAGVSKPDSADKRREIA